MYILELDLRKENTANLILNEKRILTKVTGMPDRVLIPKHGAFFDSPELKVKEGSTLLVKGKDYSVTYLYRQLSELTGGYGIYAFVVITNEAIGNTLHIDYHAVGGAYSLSPEEVKAGLEQLESTPSHFTFEQIIAKPKAYNPAEHMDDLFQIYGADNTYTVLERIVHAIKHKQVGAELTEYSDKYYQLALDRITEDENLLLAHMADKNNPHVETKQQIGLGNVVNIEMGSTNPAYYAFSQKVTDYLDYYLLPALNAHIYNYNNPHEVRSIDVNSHTKAEANALLNQFYKKTDTVADSVLFDSMNYNQLHEFIFANINTNLITQGLMSPSVMATGTSGLEYGIGHLGSWKSIELMINMYNAEYPAVTVFTTALTNKVQAKTYADANLPNAPTGAYLLMVDIIRIGNGVGNPHGSVPWRSINYLVKTDTEWVIGI